MSCGEQAVETVTSASLLATPPTLPSDQLNSGSATILRAPGRGFAMDPIRTNMRAFSILYI